MAKVIIVGILILIAITVGLLMIIVGESKIKKWGAVVLIVGFIIGGVTTWYLTSTASGIRLWKDVKSELDNGINREITITAEDGREIFHYEGKCDIESNHEDNYIKFESEDGKRYMIYYGALDTILIEEK